MKVTGRNNSGDVGEHKKQQGRRQIDRKKKEEMLLTTKEIMKEMWFSRVIDPGKYLDLWV